MIIFTMGNNPSGPAAAFPSSQYRSSLPPLMAGLDPCSIESGADQGQVVEGGQ